MISSWRGLAIAGAIALALVIAVIVDLMRTRAPVDRALVPGFDPDRVTELVWERAGEQAIRVVRAGSAWQIRAPSSAAADPGAIGDVLSALRGARWHRRGKPPPVATTLTVIAGPTRRALGIAAPVAEQVAGPIAGGDQRWIVDGGHGLLVDSWVARALDRDLLALRVRMPLGDVRRAHAIAIEGVLDEPGAAPGGAPGARVDLRVEGTPRRLVRPIELLLAAEVAGELDRALGQLAIVRVPAGPVSRPGLAIRLLGADPQAATGAVELGGPCPGAPELVAVSGTAGDGCIDRAAAAAIARAIDRLRAPPAQIAERSPISFEPARLVLADGATLELSPPRVGDAPADPARVTELLAALAAPAEVVALPPKPAAQHLVITDSAGATTTLDLFAERVVSRRSEPVALRPAPGAWNLLVRRSRELRDPVLWLEEPTTITAVRIDDVTYERGAIIGEWTRRPSGKAGAAAGKADAAAGKADAAAGKADAAAVEALVAALAAPRALGFLDDRPPVAHRVTMRISPPAGPATERAIELGPPRAAGCPVRVDRDTVLLPASVCTQVAALAK